MKTDSHQHPSDALEGQTMMTGDFSGEAYPPKYSDEGSE
jgi:hypothetical protein